MKNNLIIGTVGGIIIVVVAIGAILFLGKKPETITDANNTSTTSESKDTVDDQAEAGQTVTITYTDDGFSPNSYTVKANGRVTVMNNSSRDLEFSSNDHPVHTDEPELNMSVLQPGKSGTFTVTKTGTWGFHNHLRAEDTGKLIVQ